MNHRCLSSLFVLLLVAGACSAQSLVRTRTWAASAGTDLNLPLIGNYYDFSLVKGADYFWEYKVDPKIGIGYYAEVSSVRPLRSKKHSGFISYDLGYRQLARSMEYSGWEGGGISGVYNKGAGIKQWNDHYVTFAGSITHQFFIGIKRRIVLNALGFSAGFKVYEQEKRHFSGQSTYTDGTVIHDALGYSRSGVNPDLYIPTVHLNYRFGYVVPFGKGVIIPHVFVPILNLNNYLQKYEPNNTPLKMRREYYKEVMIGITFMRASLK